jgi:hypothetical protein
MHLSTYDDHAPILDISAGSMTAAISVTASRAAMRRSTGGLSRRIGHADVAFTMKQYMQADLEADRRVATTLAELIIGGSLASTEVMYPGKTARGRASLANPLANHKRKAPSLFEKGPLALVAGAGFEPATSGL